MIVCKHMKYKRVIDAKQNIFYVISITFIIIEVLLLYFECSWSIIIYFVYPLFNFISLSLNDILCLLHNFVCWIKHHVKILYHFLCYIKI